MQAFFFAINGACWELPAVFPGNGKKGTPCGVPFQAERKEMKKVSLARDKIPPVC